MWEQVAFNKFKNGKDEIKIDCYQTNKYLIWKNEGYEADVDSFEDVQEYLAKHNIGTLVLPTFDVELNKWHSFGGNDHYEEIFTRKLSDDVMQSVIVNHYKDDDHYGVLMRTCGYDWIEWLAAVSFEFVEEKGYLAKDILELDAYEAGTHGSSGMAECYYDLKTREDANAYIQQTYGICLPLVERKKD